MVDKKKLIALTSVVLGSALIGYTINDMRHTKKEQDMCCAFAVILKTYKHGVNYNEEVVKTFLKKHEVDEKYLNFV